LNKLLKNAVELAGIVAAFLCLIDCVVLPIVVAISPFLGLHQIVHGINDQFSTLLVIVLCSIAFFPGFLKHRNMKVAGLLALGIFFVFFANLLHEATDQFIHVMLCLFGSACIIKANSWNRKLAKDSISASEPESDHPCCNHHH
jgi:hypothetical protein